MAARRPCGGNVYTAPTLLDVAGAVEAPPELTMDSTGGRHGRV